MSPCAGLPLATAVTPLVLFALSLLPLPPALYTLRDQDHPFSRSPKVPNIRESYVAERSVERVNPRREDRRKGTRASLTPLTSHSPSAVLWDLLPKYRDPSRCSTISKDLANIRYVSRLTTSNIRTMRNLLLIFTRTDFATADFHFSTRLLLDTTSLLRRILYNFLIEATQTCHV